MKEAKNKLFIIPTPLGNLEDITLRAIRILKEVDVILAEDTRNTIHLLKHFGIEKPLRSYHQHNEHKIVEEITQEIAAGKNIALVSDAGTPGISDPGFLLIRECVKQGVEVETLPGATAFVPALVNSGLPCDAFVFYGFLPQKKGRQTKWKEIAMEDKTIVLYESPHRIVKAIEEIILYLGADRKVSLSREISKIHEETVRGTAENVLKHFTTKPPKGEFVIIISGKPEE